MSKVLSRYDHGQLNIKVPRKEYGILASQDNKHFMVRHYIGIVFEEYFSRNRF